MTITTIRELEAFVAHRQSWMELSERVPATTFQSWETNFDWWKLHSAGDADARLHVVCHWRNRELDLVLPAWVDGTGTLQFLQAGAADYLDVIAEPGRWSAALPAVADHLKSCPDIRRVRLTNLAGGSPLVSFMPNCFARKSFLLFQSDTLCQLGPELHDERRFLSHLDSKRVNDLRNIQKRVSTTATVIEAPSGSFPSDELRNLLDRMVRAGQRDGETYRTLLPFCETLFERGLLLLVCQYDGQQMRAASAVVRLRAGQILVWLDWYDPSERNISLKNYLAILELARRDALGVSLGTGAYPYKVRNFAPTLESLHTFYYDKVRARFVFYLLRKAVAKAAGVV